MHCQKHDVMLKFRPIREGSGQGEYYCSECQDSSQLAATMTTPPKRPREPFTPTDWVLVPREPTVDMVERGREALSNGDAKVQTHARVMWVWEAMISAAPTAPTTQSGDERAAGKPPKWAYGAAEEICMQPSCMEGVEADEANYAAIITKHMPRTKHTGGPGGVSLTEEEESVVDGVRHCIDTGDSLAGGGMRALLAIIARLQGSPS